MMKNGEDSSATDSAARAKEYEAIKTILRRMYKVIVVFDHEFDFYDYTLNEGVIIGIIGRNPGITASDICSDIRIDKGHLSRILKKFEDRGVIERVFHDDRPHEKQIELTSDGIRLYEEIQEQYNDCIAERLQVLDADEHERFFENVEQFDRQMAELLPDSTERNGGHGHGWIHR